MRCFFLNYTFRIESHVVAIWLRTSWSILTCTNPSKWIEPGNSGLTSAPSTSLNRAHFKGYFAEYKSTIELWHKTTNVYGTECEVLNADLEWELKSTVFVNSVGKSDSWYIALDNCCYNQCRIVSWIEFQRETMRRMKLNEPTIVPS